jgi:hypothetical protein
MGYSYKLIDAQVDGKVSFANIPNPSVAGALHGRSQAVDRPSSLPGRCDLRHPGLVRPAGVGRLGLCRVPEAEALTRQAVTMALGGDPTALRLCLERIAPYWTR